MLVLTRRIGESVFIGDGIVLTIQKVAGSRVQVGIDAPRSVPITRDAPTKEGSSGVTVIDEPATG